MDENKSSVFSNLSPGQIFTVGLVGGVMTLCTLGFLVMLPMVLGGGFGSGNSRGTTVNTVDPGSVGKTASGPKIADIAKGLGLDYDKFKSCTESQKFASKVQADEAEAQAAGGQGTPYLIVVGPKGETVPIKGAYPAAVIEGVIKRMLGQTVANAADLPPEEKVTVRAVDASKEAVRGNAKAKISLIEYSDFECPFCKQFHNTMQQVMAAHEKDVKWVYRQFPLDSLHQKARPEALMSECAGEQGKFWEFTDSVFKVTPSNDGMDITL